MTNPTCKRYIFTYAVSVFQASPERACLTPISPADPSAQYFEGKYLNLLGFLETSVAVCSFTHVADAFSLTGNTVLGKVRCLDRVCRRQDMSTSSLH